MSGVFSFWGNRKQTMNDVIRLPEVFPFGLCRRDFIIFKLISIYENLLTQCYNRSRGFPEDMAKTLWNNYEALDPLNTRGVIRLLSVAMAERRTMAISYDRTTNVAKEAMEESFNEIYEDYQKQTKSDKGIYVNFELYYKSKIIAEYLNLLYSALLSAYAQLGLSRAIQFKADKLRETQANNSNTEWKDQAKEVVDSVLAGRAVLISKDDDLKLPEVDADPIKNAIEFYGQLIAGELGVSTSFITGIIRNGMNSTGEAELVADENGIKVFFYSIFKPCCDGLYKINLEFVTDNYRKTAELAKVIPYLESSEAVSNEQLERFVNYVLGEND